MLVERLNLFFSFMVQIGNYTTDDNKTIVEPEDAARIYMNQLMGELETQLNILTEASWAYDSNLTDHNLELMTNASVDYANFMKNSGLKLLEYDYQKFSDPDLRRKFKLMTKLGDTLLPEEQFKNLTEIVAGMSNIFATSEFPSYKNASVNVTLNPDLYSIFSSSRDAEELKYYWKNWYDRAGTQSKDLFFQYVELRNEAAKLNSEYSFLV